ncbi:MAG: hypothetical protein P4M15_09285 [Alphaproteobacteria bacterium]|nr:hypothetical protein [Alphaproteobacteria bacterium]
MAVIHSGRDHAPHGRHSKAALLGLAALAAVGLLGATGYNERDIIGTTLDKGAVTLRDNAVQAADKGGIAIRDKTFEAVDRSATALGLGTFAANAIIGVFGGNPDGNYQKREPSHPVCFDVFTSGGKTVPCQPA